MCVCARARARACVFDTTYTTEGATELQKGYQIDWHTYACSSWEVEEDDLCCWPRPAKRGGGAREEDSMVRTARISCLYI